MKEVLHQLRQIAICGLLLIAAFPTTTVSSFGSASALGSRRNATPPPQFAVVPSPLFEDDQTIFVYAHEYLPFATGERVQAFRSSDGGDSWWPIFRLSDRYRIQGQLIVGLPFPDHVSPVIYFLLDSGLDSTSLHLLRSLDGGDTWEERTSSQCSSTVLTDNSNVLFAKCFQLEPWNDYVGIERSQDSSLTWEQIWSDSGVYQIAPSPAYSQDDTVFASTQLTSVSPPFPSLIASFDGGDSWVDRDAGLCDHMTVGAIALSPDFSHDQTLFASQTGALTENGKHVILFKSEDAGLSWQQVYSQDGQVCEDYPYAAVGSLVTSPDYPTDHVLFREQPDSSLYVSYDDGHSWQILARGGYDVNVRRNPLVPLHDDDTTTSQNHPVGDDRYLGDFADASHQAFLAFIPQVLARGPRFLPLTLFVSRGTSPPMRSEDGGVTWYEMTLPPYRTTFLPMLVASP